MNMRLSPNIVLTLLVVLVAAQVSYGQDASIFFQGAKDAAVYSVDPDGSNLRIVAEGRNAVRSPDGLSILVTQQGNVAAVSSEGLSVSLGPDAVEYAWSPDGQQIAFHRYSSIFVTDRDGSNERMVAEDGWRPCWLPSDASYLFYNRSRPPSMEATDIFLTNIVTGESRLVRELMFIPQVPYPFSPDGTRLFVSDSGREGVNIMSLVTGELVQIGPSGDRVGAQRPAWSPDGNYIVFEVLDGMGGLYLADSKGQGIIELVPGRNDAAPGGATWSPDGSRIAFHVVDFAGERASEIYVINKNGTGMRKLAEGRWPVWASNPSGTRPLGGGTIGTMVQPQTWGEVKGDPR